ncbi:tetratricopeptide repeat protein [Nitratifractor sp.]
MKIWMLLMSGMLALHASAAGDRSACGAGDAAACESLGVRYITGDGVRLDGHMALRYLEKACGMGRGTACNGAAFIYADAEGGVRQDYTKAMSYWSRACRLGDPTGCANYQLAQDKIREARRRGTLRKASPAKHSSATTKKSHRRGSPLDALSE